MGNTGRAVIDKLYKKLFRFFSLYMTICLIRNMIPY
jgi:hypothetical protein